MITSILGVVVRYGAQKAVGSKRARRYGAFYIARAWCLDADACPDARASRASADHRHFSWTSDLSASFFLFFASGGGEADKWKVAAPPAVVHDEQPTKKPALASQKITRGVRWIWIPKLDSGTGMVVE